MKTSMKKTFGDPTKLTKDTFTARGRKAALREDPPVTYVPPKKATKIKK